MGDDINTTLPMILSIVAMIFCCGISFFLGVGGLVLSIQAGNSKKTGDMESARSKAKTALILAIAALAIGVLQAIGWGVFNAMNS
jgi:fatty acid desaturase